MVTQLWLIVFTMLFETSMSFHQKEKKQLEESLAEIKEQEDEMSRANRALTIRLEDVQVS